MAADLDGTPALFIVESGTSGVSIEAEPAMGLRAASTGRLVLEKVSVPAGALLGGGSRADLRDCIRLARIGWSALALGTAQAVLDYVIPYVNERQAFGEPISHRQSVAFMVANIGIELEGARLVTYRAASRAEQGKSFARETALARRLTSEYGMQIGSSGVQLLGGHGYVKEHPVERWYRDLRSIAVMEGVVFGLMTINLEVPKKFGMLINQAHQVSTEIFRPISRKYDTAEHEYPKELDMLASLHRRHERLGRDRDGRARRPPRERRRQGQQERREPVGRALDHRGVLG